MSAALNHNIPFVKMSGVGNDFVIFDARRSYIFFDSEQIKKISDRKNIGCDQLIIIKNKEFESSDLAAFSSSATSFFKGGYDAVMEIYNCDGSLSGACGNATRCVAAILLSETKKSEIKIKTAAGILTCWKNGDLISVNMGTAKFMPDVALHGFNFSCVDVGNPHAVTFLDQELSDKKFFDVGPKVEADKFFPNKTNVEFAHILADDLIEVRVFERGSGETLACGSGACAVAALAIKKSLVKSKKVTIRFKGGDLEIELKDDSSIVMTGAYQKIFAGEIDESFLP